MMRIILLALLLLPFAANAAYRDSTAAVGSAGEDSVTINVPTNVDGDVIACTTETQAESVTWGFTAASSGTYTTGGGSGRGTTFAWATKLASSEPSTYTISIGGGNELTIKAVCVSISGRDSATPSASQATNDAGASSTPISTPLTGVTAAAGDDIVIFTGAAASAASTATMAFSAPTDYTTRATQEIIGGPFHAGAVAVATRDNVSAGATGTLTGSWTLGSGHADTAGVVLAFAAGEGGVVATKLIFGSQPGNVVVGQQFGAFTVRAVDDDDALDEEFTSNITIALQTGEGALAGTLTRAASAGIATFDDVYINTLNTGAVIRATATGLTSVDSSGFNVTAGGGGGTAGFPSTSRLGGMLQ